METWKETKYPGYFVSNLGNVLSPACTIIKTRNGKQYEYNKPERILKQTINAQGYPSVSIRTNGGGHQVTVHRLVAEAFIPNPDNLPVVDHINGDTTDYSIDNLRWVSYQDNNKNIPTTRELLKRIETLEAELAELRSQLE